MISLITEKNSTEHSIHHFSTEASQLGLSPGYVPRFLETTLGNKQRFILDTADCNEFRYTQAHGCIILVIYND